MYTYGHTMSLHDALPIWQILLVLAVLLLLPMPVLDDDAVLIVIKVHRRAALGALPVLDGLARALAGWPLALVRRRRQARFGIEIEPVDAVAEARLGRQEDQQILQDRTSTRLNSSH